MNFLTAFPYWLAPFLICVVISSVVLLTLLRTGWAWTLATDVPTHRSLHTLPTPRVGGWGVSPAAVLGITWFAPQLWPVALLALLLAVICQIDDRRGLSARVRFLAQAVAATAIGLLFPLGFGYWLTPFIILALIWMTNLYNFMDGADGLAGGMAVLGFSAYAAASFPFAPPLGIAAVAVTGAAAGFLIFNLPPAKLFLGDAGSIPLGFLAGAMGVIGAAAHIWPVWFPFMVFSPFIADASVTLLRRVCRGQRFWEAHREHYYQRMIRMDGSHRRTICAWYGLIAVGALLSLLMLHLQMRQASRILLGMGCLWAVVLLSLGYCVDRRWVRFDRAEKQL
ncbi:MAG: MraY family glycosyltransferase [Janthinobacterium lividum]